MKNLLILIIGFIWSLDSVPYQQFHKKNYFHSHDLKDLQQLTSEKEMYFKEDILSFDKISEKIRGNIRKSQQPASKIIENLTVIKYVNSFRNILCHKIGRIFKKTVHLCAHSKIASKFRKIQKILRRHNKIIIGASAIIIGVSIGYYAITPFFQDKTLKTQNTSSKTLTFEVPDSWFHPLTKMLQELTEKTKNLKEVQGHPLTEGEVLSQERSPDIVLIPNTDEEPEPEEFLNPHYLSPIVEKHLKPIVDYNYKNALGDNLERKLPAKENLKYLKNNFMKGLSPILSLSVSDRHKDNQVGAEQPNSGNKSASWDSSITEKLAEILHAANQRIIEDDRGGPIDSKDLDNWLKLYNDKTTRNDKKHKLDDLYRVKPNIYSMLDRWEKDGAHEVCLDLCTSVRESLKPLVENRYQNSNQSEVLNQLTDGFLNGLKPIIGLTLENMIYVKYPPKYV